MEGRVSTYLRILETHDFGEALPAKGAQRAGRQ
jgi:hypothetical protein